MVIGCGDVGLRLAQRLPAGVRCIALTSSQARLPELRAHGILPLQGNLDDKTSLRRLAGIATRLVHLAPPASDDPVQRIDPRTRSLVQVLSLRTPPVSVVYASTSGVYGDCHGELVPESRRVDPQTPRAWRRVNAEASLRFFGCVTGTSVHILRIPGIYAPDREGGTPRGRLLKALPVLRPEDDVYTNHIHADDLARACSAALWRGKPQRITNVSDDSQLKMGDYFDMAADLYRLPRPPRVTLAEARLAMSAMQLSFMSESRRLVNRRLKNELRITLRYPTASTGLL